MKISIILLTMILGFSSASFALGVETLYGSIIGIDGITIQVASGGCTTPESFVVSKTVRKNVTQLIFKRVQDDPCLALYPYGLTMSYSYAELGLRPSEFFIVANPRMAFSVPVFGH